MTHIVGFDYHSRKPEQTKLVLSEVLGFKLIEEGSAIELYQAENGHKEDYVKVIKNMNVPLGFRGAGSVHHVAFSVQDEKNTRRLEEKKYKPQALESARLQTEYTSKAYTSKDLEEYYMR